MGLTKNYGTTLYTWLSQFAPTYREPITESQFKNKTKPTEYISYSSTNGNFSGSFIQPISIYSKSTAYNHIMDIVDAIEDAIGESGIRLNETWGTLTIYKGNPFYQDKAEEDTAYRAGYVNLEITIYQYNV